MDIIRSKTNNLVKQVKKLQQKKYRTSSYLIEGWHLLEEAMEAGAKIEHIFVVEDVQDPGNVGTMIRTADAAGLDGVFLSDKSADIYNMKVLRSMQGSHFHLPVYRMPISSILTALKSNQIQILATTLSSQSVDYKEITSNPSFALVMGNEGQGISDLMADEADQLVHITMPGKAESLNVAIAAGILLFSFI